MKEIILRKTEKGGYTLRGPWWFWILILPTLVACVIALSRFGVFSELAKLIHG